MLDLRALEREPLAATLKGLAARAVGQPLPALGRALRTAAPTIALRGIEAFKGVFGGSDHTLSANAK